MNHLRAQVEQPQVQGYSSRRPKGTAKVHRFGPQAPLEHLAQVGGPPPRTPSSKQQSAQMDAKQKVKQPKLLSSKSLSQLIPRSLFFKKTTTKEASQGEQLGQNTSYPLASTKSFPSAAFRPNAMHMMNNTPEYVNRLNSASLIGLPGRQSLGGGQAVLDTNCTLEQASLSPIVGLCDQEGGGGDTNTAPDSSREEARGGRESQEGTEAGKKNKAGGRYRPFKGTTLVLRDVKNSIGLVSSEGW